MALIAAPNDVYNYETAKDPDPRWRERCQRTSWYNERDTVDGSGTSMPGSPTTGDPRRAGR